MKLLELLEYLLWYTYRYDKCIPVQIVRVPEPELTPTRRIQELEAEVASLNAQLTKLKEDNQLLQKKCDKKDSHIHDLNLMISVFEKMVPNIHIIHTDRADQINAVVEAGAKVSHTDKK